MHTDLNQRERRRYGRMLRDLAEAATKCADAIEAEDDQTVLVQLILISLQGPTIGQELSDVFIKETEASKTKIPDTVDDIVKGPGA